MANIKSINSNPIVPDSVAAGSIGTAALADGAVTKAKLGESVMERISAASASAPTAAPKGEVVTASDAAPATPKHVTIDGKSTQSGTPTPSDPVSIVSIDDVEMCVSGKNLLKASSASATNHSLNRSFDGSTNLLTMSGTPDANNTDLNITLTNPIYVPVGTSLVFSLHGTVSAAGSFTVHLKDSGGNYPQYKSMGSSTTTVTYDNVGGKTIAGILVRCSTSTGLTSVSAYAQLELGSASGTFAPPTGITTLPIDLDGHELRSLPDGTCDTVEIDAVGNVTLVQRVGYANAAKITAATQEPTVLTDYVRIPNGQAIADARSPASNYSNGYCNVAPFSGAGYSSDTLHAATNNSGIYIFAPSADKATWSVDTAKEWIVEHSVEIVYPLATPVEIDLGTVTLPTLPAPELTAWADPSTDIQLTYERDATIVIAGIVSQLGPVDGPTATSNHAVGELLVLGETLVKVTSAIATGETIAIGTNVAATTVAAELALKANAS